MSRSILIASGKGGVGKSVFTANLGAALADRNASVVIIDADIGLRSQDAFLGLENLVVYDLIDVADKDCSLDDALLESPFSRNLKLYTIITIIFLGLEKHFSTLKEKSGLNK